MSYGKRHPPAGNRLVRIVLYGVIVAAVLVLVFLLVRLVPKFMEYRKSDAVYEKMSDMSITEYQLSDEESGKDKIPDVKDALQIDWDAFRDTEIVAWFQMDDISYPIMQHEDDAYYLHHLPDGSYNSGGSLFLLSHNNPFLTDQSSFVYGHNMNNGSMFGKLKQYLFETFKDHMFYIYLPDGTRHVYQFFSVAKVPQDSKAYIWSFESDATFLEWQNWMLEQSMVPASLSSSQDARYVTLSTCSGYSGTNNRLVVCGQEVRVDKLQKPASWYQDYKTKYEQKNEAKVQRASEIQQQLERVQQEKLDALYRKFTE